MARSAIFSLAREYDPNEILLQLRRHAPHAFHFCFQLAQNKAFLGITPELLYRRSGRKIESEAIASTRPRGQTLEEDERLAKDLLESEGMKGRRKEIIYCIIWPPSVTLRLENFSIFISPYYCPFTSRLVD